MLLIVLAASVSLVPTSARFQDASVVARTEHFELRSDPRVALHHFLIDWAAADAGEWPRYALPLAERDGWQDELDPEERRIWSASVNAYAATLGRSLVFDEGLLAVRDWAVGGAMAGAAREGIPPADRPLADALAAALPIYQRHWWPAHDEKNRAWIESVAPTLAAMEQRMVARFEAAYGGKWPSVRTPIDVMVYTNAVGAYSSAGRLTISSADRGNQMPQAVEMVFHESSHTDELEGALRDGIDAAFRSVGAEPPERFWHDVIFFTSGEITRLVFVEDGVSDYQHYGSFGVYRRGERWTTELPALEEAWKPFLASGSSSPAARRAALEALAAALAGQ